MFHIEEGTQPFFKKRMQGSVIYFTEDDIKNISEKLDEKFGLSVNEDESAEDDTFIISLQIRVKRTKVEDKCALMNAIVESIKAAVEPHIILSKRKKPSSQV